MSKVKFLTTGGIRNVDCISNRHLLLVYYIGEFRGDYELNEEIAELEKIRDGLYDYETDLRWRDTSFGAGYGMLDYTETSSKRTIYFEAREDDTQHDSFDVDIQEVIDYLYEWKAYLGY